MKKLIIPLLAVTLLFTGCSGQKSYTADQVKEIVEPYMYKLSIGLSTEWCGDEDDKLLETAGGSIFKSLLESMYHTDNGREIYNEDYMVKIEDYVDVATEYFPYDKEFITGHFKTDRTYDTETDMIACSDGLGGVVSMEISSVEQSGDVYKVNYDAYGLDNAFFEDYGYLTVKINKKGKLVFWGNSRNYTEKDIENMFLHYVPVAMVTYNWDSNFSRESLDNNMFLLSAALEGLYYDTYHEYMYEKNKGLYDSDFRIKVSDLVKMAERHFTFDGKFVREFFESWDSYDADSDTIIEPDGFGMASNIHNIRAEKDGDVFKVTYDHSYFDEEPTKDFGTMTVQVIPSGHMVFLSNAVNKNATEQLQDTEFKLQESYSAETLNYSANVIAAKLVGSMSTQSVPENPEFNKKYFLFAMASWKYQNENFIYNNAFPYEENGYNTVFDFDTCEKVIYQVYGDSSWQAKDNFSEDYIQGDKAVQSTDIGWGVLFYGLKEENRQVIFSDDGTQITVRAEMVGPGDTTYDPEMISCGIYDVVLDIVKENGEQFLRFNRFAIVDDKQNNTDNSNTDNITPYEADILLAVENIDQAHSFYYGKFISGDMVDGDKILPEDKSPYPDSNYYAHLPEYDTVEELKALACRYFSEEVFENSFISEFEPKYEEIPPYLIEVDGTIYTNLNYGTGGKVIFMPETAKVTEVNGNSATVTLQYYNAMDESLKETTTVDMIYENGKWVFNQAFLLKQYE